MNTVYFAHGKESGPWGVKITALANLARQFGFEVISPDYSSTGDADERVRMLLALKPSISPGDRLVLVGSSMGGYVSTVASAVLKPDGLFLLAPAFYINGYREQAPRSYAKRTVIVHGWHDDVVPLEHSIRFARAQPCALHILNSDHSLTSALPEIEALFKNFLEGRSEA
jgi:pimeloyl-ACP methyl ester carboxylesterase